MGFGVGEGGVTLTSRPSPPRCSEKSAFWYRDSACSSRVSKVGVAVGVPVAALVVAVVIFTAFLVRARRQTEAYRQERRRREGWGGEVPPGPHPPAPSHHHVQGEADLAVGALLRRGGDLERLPGLRHWRQRGHVGR